MATMKTLAKRLTLSRTISARCLKQPHGIDHGIEFRRPKRLRQKAVQSRRYACLFATRHRAGSDGHNGRASLDFHLLGTGLPGGAVPVAGLKPGSFGLSALVGMPGLFGL